MEDIPAGIRKELQSTERKNPGAIVSLLDAAGYFKYVSQSAQDITGHSPQEALGRHFLDYYYQPDSAHMAIAMQDVLLNGRSVLVTRDVKLKEGGTRRMRGDAWKVTDEATGLVYVLSVSRPLEVSNKN
jgi:PAS domain S-box-containing protein